MTRGSRHPNDAQLVVHHLFVYGTLRPGDVRWSFLAPWVADDGVADSVPGTLHDTGLGYPAAIFEPGRSVVIGLTYRLVAETMIEALELIDAEERSVPGGFERIEVTTAHGTPAWAYQYGGGLDVVTIPGGDWTHR